MARELVRAYQVPPYRAEEFHFYSAYQSRFAGDGPGSLLSVTPNGLPAVPNGYRGVICVVGTECISNRANYAFDDLSDGNRYDFRVNGVAVPGYSNRPIGSRLSFQPFAGRINGADVTLDCYGYFGVVSPLVIVPIKLQSADVLSIRWRQPTSITDTLISVLVQGYWWPAKDEDDRGAGNQADPIP